MQFTDAAFGRHKRSGGTVFFPLLLKLVAWHGERLGKLFRKVLPRLISSGSFLPLFISLVDLPILVVALEKVEKSSRPLLGNAYLGSTIEDGAGDSNPRIASAIDVD
ncbi:hypothetical protein K1719_031569 [Acacia pycnantha]|nr:hypothetical protein K1719_031569 [Acacia pycnantha]